MMYALSGAGTTSGLYALVNLNGAPLPPADCDCLFLAPTAAPFGVRAYDPIHPAMATMAQQGTRQTWLLGYIDAAAELAGTLGLAAATPPAMLARAALDRFGRDAPSHMWGEWTLLDHSQSATVLMSSATRRDQAYFAVSGDRLAVAPEIGCLRRLDWVGDTPDEAALMLMLARHAVRQHIGARTALRNVRLLRPGASLWLRPGAPERLESWSMPVEFEPFPGTFTDAVETLDTMLRKTVRHRLDMTRSVACYLSGGVDSSLLSMLVAETRAAGQSVTCISSVAPPGSGLVDESAAAGMVARHLGLPWHPVAPELDASPYVPAPGLFGYYQRPLLGPRQYLYDRLHGQALALGCDTVFDGCYGEIGVTASARFSTLRYRLGEAVRKMRGEPGRLVPPRGPFAIKLAAHRVADPPAAVRAAMDNPRPAILEMHRRGDRWGYMTQIEKFFGGITELVPGRLRMFMPFRDPRLVRFMAGIPVAFLAHGGRDRAIARALMRGHLPDAIVDRPKGPPFSPDYQQRLGRHATAARARIPLFRRAGADDWVDLDWLDARLAEFAAGKRSLPAESMAVQGTALMAEFVVWQRGLS